MNKIFLISIILASFLFGQDGGVILRSLDDEKLILAGEPYSANQLHPSVACDGLLNSASTYILDEEQRYVYLGLYSSEGLSLNHKLFPVESEVEEVISKVGVGKDGSGLLMIAEKYSDNFVMKCYRFNMSGSITSEPESLPIELYSSNLFNFAVSDDNTVAVSWIKSEVDDTTATLLTRFYNYDLTPKTEIIVSETDIDTTDLLNIKHEFRDDNSSMAFIYYSVYPVGNPYKKFDCAGWRSFDTSFIPDSDFYTMNLFDGARGSDITIGPPGIFYTVELWQVTTPFSEGPMYIKRWNRYGVRVASNTLNASFQIPNIKFRNNKLYIFFQYNAGFGLSILSPTLKVISYWKLVSKDYPDLMMMMMIQGAINDSDEYLFACNGAEFINGKSRTSLHLQRFDSDDNPLTEIFKPEATFKRADINLIGTAKYLDTKHCTIWDTEYHHDYSINFQNRNPQLSVLDDAIEFPHIDYNDYMKKNVAISFNKNFSRLFFSWTDYSMFNSRTQRLSYPTTNRSQYIFEEGSRVSRAKVLPAGEEDFVAFMEKLYITDSTKTIVASRFDEESEQIGEFFNIESEYQYGTHFSTDFQVYQREENYLIIWLRGDSVKSEFKLLARKIPDSFVVTDSAIAQIDYTGSEIVKPLGLKSFDSELYLAVQYLESYNSSSGDLALWKITEIADTLIEHEEIYRTENQITSFDNFWFPEENVILFSYKDNEGIDYFELLNTDTWAQQVYEVASLSSHTNMEKFCIEQYDDKLFMVYEAELDENDVKSKALFQQTFVAKDVVVNPNDGGGDGNDDEKENEVEQIPEKFEISGNYPNPFNPSTSIEIQLPDPGWVKFEVFNALGEIVDVPEFKVYQQGVHKLEFNGDNFPSGVYLYRVTYKQKIYSGKMLLLK